uniref:M23 family metallopeptidase n=1 Tax=candidate division WOR-3 bacterium TaxID=2052148 RepID=A0A7V0Z771_UNCW3
MNQGFTIILIGHNNFLKSLFLSARLLIAILIFFGIITISAIGLFIHNTRVSISEIKQNIAEEQHRAFSKRIGELKNRIAELKKLLGNQIAIDNKQRNFLQIASIHPDIWSMGIGGINIPKQSTNLSIYNAKLIEELYESVNILKGQVRLREMSINELENKISQNFDLWRHIPSINPVPGAEISSGFGYRVDPFEKDVRMHEGVDFSASKGTPVYATGDGIVTFADWNMGYGYVIDIDHGYGFVTRYAHLSKMLVREGETVKRGQIIARVGGTGRAVCPHLHYEVVVAGIKVNPVNYINFKDIIID